MPSRRPRRRLLDIIDNIDRIRGHVQDMGREGYLADAKTQDAVERCFQRISEAAVKLGDDADARYPEIPWRDIRRFGNVLRHEYDAVGHDLIWTTIEERLEPLRRACEQEILRLTKSDED